MYSQAIGQSEAPPTNTRTGRPKVRVAVACFECGAPIERYPKQIERSRTGRFFCGSCAPSAARKPPTRARILCALDECTVEFDREPSSARRYCCVAHATTARWQRAGSVPETRSCELEGCERRFVVTPSDPKRFCSPEHANDARVTKITRICPGCGEPFTDTPSRIGEYHSRACRNNHLRVECLCLYCGHVFRVSASEKANGGGKYCCDDHRIAGRRTNAIDRWHNGKPVVKMRSKSKNTTRTYLKLWQPDHPRAHVTGWVMEHVYEACLKYGRIIPLSEHVHHVDRDGENNSWDNLIVLSHEEHARLTAIENAGRAAAADDYLIALAKAERSWNDVEAVRARLAVLESS